MKFFDYLYLADDAKEKLKSREWVEENAVGCSDIRTHSEYLSNTHYTVYSTDFPNIVGLTFNLFSVAFIGKDVLGGDAVPLYVIKKTGNDSKRFTKVFVCKEALDTETGSYWWSKLEPQFLHRYRHIETSIEPYAVICDIMAGAKACEEISKNNNYPNALPEFSTMTHQDLVSEKVK